MLRIVLVGVASLALGGCANGWPYVKHPAAGSQGNCTPTTSKIARSNCVSSAPVQAATQEDLDREQRPQSAPIVPPFPH